MVRRRTGKEKDKAFDVSLDGVYHLCKMERIFHGAGLA